MIIIIKNILADKIIIFIIIIHYEYLESLSLSYSQDEGCYNPAYLLWSIIKPFSLWLQIENIRNLTLTALADKERKQSYISFSTEKYYSNIE